MMKAKIGDNLYLNKKTGQITTNFSLEVQCSKDWLYERTIMTKADLITAKAEIAKLKE